MKEDSVCKLLDSQFSEIQYFQDFKYFNSITGTPNEMITSRGLNPPPPNVQWTLSGRIFELWLAPYEGNVK